MNTLLQTLLVSLVGSIIVINDISLPVENIIEETHRVTNSANIYQLAAVLEVYYLDTGEYPTVEGVQT